MGELTASDGARLHQKRLIIGSSSSGAATSGDWAHNTLGSGWLQWRWCGGVGHVLTSITTKGAVMTLLTTIVLAPAACLWQTCPPLSTSSNLVREQLLRTSSSDKQKLGLRQFKSHLKMVSLQTISGNLIFSDIMSCS